MRNYHSVILKGFYDPMENESATHGGDKEPNDTGNCINSQGANSFDDISGIGQA